MREPIYIHVEAPPKPAPGAPCNGCGLCCLAEPCPVGMLVSRRRSGACAALRWQEAEARYVCGMLADPLQALGWRRPAPDGRAGRWLAAALRAWTRRMIAAGQGCDADLDVRLAEPPSR